MGFTDNLKNRIRAFLEIEEKEDFRLKIRNGLDFDANAIINKIWYNGESNELTQLYSYTKSIRPDDKYKFWASVGTSGLELQKRHTGIAGTIVDTLESVVMTDFNGFSFDSESKVNEEFWNAIAEENGFEEMIKEAVKDMLIIGDGAFKISIDPQISQNPIVEFWAGDKIDVRLRRNRLDEIVFKSLYKQDHKDYELHEIYGRGYIKYELYNDGVEYPLDTIDALKDLVTVTFDGGVLDENDKVVKRGGHMLAVLMKFGSSGRWKGRGQSIYHRKIDNFDALDEAYSQWMDALRKGRTKEYIPECLIPRDPNTGQLRKPNAFDNAFVATSTDMSEGAQNRIVTETPTIQHDAYLSTYITALDLCLQGIISPSTLGIDTKKLDNAEAQREKEKTTLYTRNKIIDVLSVALPELVNATLACKMTMESKPIEDIEVSLNFGEYANPSFESQIETVGKGRTQGILSIEASVEELYGDSKEESWKKDEVKRLKEEAGIVEVEEPAVNLDAFNND